MNNILHGDALTELKKIDNNIIDLGVTSPPYNKGEKNKGWLVKNVKYRNFKDTSTEEEYQNNQILVLNELYRITKEGGSFFYNHKLRWDKGKMLHPMEWLLKTHWTIKQEIIWDRMIAANIRGWRFWQVEEKVFWLYKPVNKNKIGAELLSKHALLTSIWRFPPERNNQHPAPFPLSLPTRIIYSILNEESGLVIDPYMGSGTTLVAAKLLNKKYIGIDISKDYIEMAKDRLKNCEMEKDNLEKELSKHIVRKTFSDRKKNNEFTGRYKKKERILSYNQKSKNLFNFLKE